MNVSVHPSSFRDPSGFIFSYNEQIYRQINLKYKDDYNLLINSGLSSRLIEEKLMIDFKETKEIPQDSLAFKIIKPEKIPFISYPYEWCFSQYKDAALLTLKIQKLSYEYGMTLKDSSAYNIQFVNSMPVLIDTLSFEKYEEGLPWVAYKQFCQHFLAPLLFMKYCHIKMIEFMQTNIDGIPLDLTSRLLPKSTWLNFPILLNIHLHAKSIKRYSSGTKNIKRNKFGKQAYLGLIDNLETFIKKLNWNGYDTEWGNYIDNTNYSKIAQKNKEEIVSQYIDQINPTTVWDLGANTGIYSRCASAKGSITISFDGDHAAVEKNYLSCKANKEKKYSSTSNGFD